MSEWGWLLHVICKDISVIYVTVHRCTGGLKKKFDIRSVSQRHIHFVGFFNVPVQALIRDQPFYGYSEKPPQFSRLLRYARGYGGHILALTIGSPSRHIIESWIYMYKLKMTLCDINEIVFKFNFDFLFWSPPPPGKFCEMYIEFWEMYIGFEEMVNS